uniref:hypothetical protein n=1 Tax=Clostridium akagii TaxID=91623 RepID=UPI000479C9E7
MFVNIFIVCIEIVIALFLIGISVYFLVYCPYLYIMDRIYHNDIFDNSDGLCGKLTIIPKFLSLVNFIFYVVILMNISHNILSYLGLNTTRTTRFFDLMGSYQYNKLTALDYLSAVMAFLSIFVFTEIIRFIEYKIHKGKGVHKLLLTSDEIKNITDGYVTEYGKKIYINEINGDKIIVLEEEP